MATTSTVPTAAPTPSTSSPRITLHWLNKSRAQRTLWLLEELTLPVPYAIKIYHRTERGLAPPELKDVHPLGKSPVVTVETETAGAAEGEAVVGEGRKRLVLAESAFIVEYLCEKFGSGRLVPERYGSGGKAVGGSGTMGEETEAWMRYKYLMSYVEGSLMPYLVVHLISERIRTAPAPFFIKPISSRIASGLRSNFVDPNLASHFSYLESQLATSPRNGKYICGEQLTGADILLSFPVIAGVEKGLIDGEVYPRLVEYAGVLKEEEGYKRAVAKIVEMEGGYEVVD